MPYEPKPGDVSAFKNDKKGNDRAPDFRGYAIAHRDIKVGEKLELVLWSREGTKGGWFYSGKISDIRGPKNPAPQRPAEEDSDSIPF